MRKIEKLIFNANNKAEEALAKVNALNISPKGVYETVVVLETVFPTGDDNIYIVLEDDNWYYWDGNDWKAGGLYQSANVDLSGKSLVYVSKKGNNANLGTKDSPKLTIQSAVDLATTKIDTDNPQASVIVLDAGRYTENITLADNVHLFAERATIVGRINIRNSCEVNIYAHYASENGQTMLYKDGTAHAYYRTVVSDGRGLSGTITGVSNIYNITASSILFTEVELMFVGANGIGVREVSSTTGHIHFNIKDLYLAGNGAKGVYGQGTASNIIGKIDHILKIGSPTNTTAIQTNTEGCILKITAEEISADTAYNVEVGQLYLNCPKITGTEIGTPLFLPTNKKDFNELSELVNKIKDAVILLGGTIEE